METTYLRVADDWDAESIFCGLQFYSRGAHNSQEVKFGELKADREEHRWEEETLEFLKLQTKVKLAFYTLSIMTEKGLPKHTLEMEISGEDLAREATIKKIGAVTGVSISKYISNTKMN